MRDYFYDPNMHGNDWPAMRQRFAALLPRVGSRSELNDLISQLVAELCALHVFVSGARDEPREPTPHATTGHLGAVLQRAPSLGGYVVRSIFHQDPDLIASKPASPLDRPLGYAACRSFVSQPVGGPGLCLHALFRVCCRRSCMAAFA